MDKRSKVVLYIIGAVILFIMIAEVVKPKPLNWRDSYSASDKIPLGCYVLYNELNTFSKDEVLDSDETIYEYLKTVDSTSNKTLLLINNSLGFDEEESLALLDFVEKGNTVFMSSVYMYGKIIDTLNIDLKQEYSGIYKKDVENSFVNPKLKNTTGVFKDVIENSYFTSIDTLKTTTLGEVTLKNEDEFITEINFIKVSFGNNNGQFILHSNPYAFTNYHILNNNEDYAATVLSYLPDNQFIWDNNYKSGKRVVRSPLRYILNNTALKWCFYISMFSLILFVIFRGKRTQRIIPVIKPLENSTVGFTETIGELYYQHGDFSNIIYKKIEYFLEFVRTQYFLNTNQLNASFIDKLSVKSANTKEDSKMLVDYIVYLKSKTQHTEKELIELNKKIEYFTKQQR